MALPFTTQAHNKILHNHYLKADCQLFNVGGYDDRIAYLKTLLESRVVPHMGNVSRDLDSVKTSHDWKARILCDQGKPVAAVIFQTVFVQDSYVGRTIPIRYLFTVDPNVGKKGYEETLVDYVIEFSKSYFKYTPDLSFSTCAHEVGTIEAFKDKGFKVFDQLENFIVKGHTHMHLKLEGSGVTEKAAPIKGLKITMPGSVERDSGVKRGWDEDDGVPAYRDTKRARGEGADYSRKPREERIPLKGLYIAQIKSGRKTIEGRINSGMFKNLASGTVVEFHNNSDSVKCKVVKKVVYSSFREMLEKEGVQKCLPECRSVDDGARIYDAIPSYTDKARAHGVLAIHLQLT